MKPIFSQARKEPKRVVLAEGEDTRVLHATQELITLWAGETDSDWSSERYRNACPETGPANQTGRRFRNR